MCIITHAVWITLSVQDNTLHTLCDITQRVSNYYTLYSKRPIFRVQSGKKLHQAEKIYTGTACGACDKYEVWLCIPGIRVTWDILRVLQSFNQLTFLNIRKSTFPEYKKN